MFDVSAFTYAHRGLWGAGRPENSAAAFQAAAEAGLGVELDVRATSDGLPVVFHDRDATRMCGNSARIGDMSAHELQYLGLPDGSGIPMLADAIAASAPHPVLVEIKIDELECAGPRDLQLVDTVAETIRSADTLLAVMSFSERAVRRLASLALGCPVGQLIEPVTEAPETEAIRKAGRALETGATYLAPHLSILPMISAAFPGVPLVTWTVRTRHDLALARRHRAAPIFETISPALAIGPLDTI